MPFTTQFFQPEWGAQRSQLLQSSLRDPYMGYPITHEYPIVLNPKHGAFSICALNDGRLAAHANMWPRSLIDARTKQNFRIALIGNVATHPSYRGQGIMRTLFEFVFEKAHDEQLEALILWSDLDQFYQKLGFAAFGTEYRWVFGANAFDEFKGPANFAVENKLLWNARRCETALAARHATRYTLERNSEEFASLLHIPDLLLITCSVFDKLQGYGLVGKGADMVGVIHEWGASDPSCLLGLIREAFVQTKLTELMLLTPPDFEKDWSEQLHPLAKRVTKHAMALGKILPDSKILDFADSCFVWGLDSI